MEVLAPDQLPGVGMGDIASLGGLGGLLGLAVTSGALMAAGLPGALVYVLAAILVLAGNDERWGDQPLVSGVVLAAVLAVATIRTFAAERMGTRMVWLGAVLAGAALGYAWAEWNEGAFTGVDGEAWIAMVVGVAGALLGAWSAHRFVSGSVRAGGSLAIVGLAVAIVALALNAASFYVPFVGYVVAALALIVAMRLRRRDREKYKGLRILS